MTTSLDNPARTVQESYGEGLKAHCTEYQRHKTPYVFFPTKARETSISQQRIDDCRPKDCP